MHASSVNANNDYWDKCRIPMGVAEIFSTFLEGLTKNATYLGSLIGSGKDNNNSDDDDNTISKLISKNHVMELFFITFYTANSLIRLDLQIEINFKDLDCLLLIKLKKV
jgi:hypothetical protein